MTFQVCNSSSFIDLLLYLGYIHSKCWATKLIKNINYIEMSFLSSIIILHASSHLPWGWWNPWVFILKEALWVVQLLSEASRYQLPNHNYCSTLTVRQKNCSSTSYGKYYKTHMPELLAKVMLVPLCNFICPNDDKCRAPEKPSGLCLFSLNRMFPPRTARPPTTLMIVQHHHRLFWYYLDSEYPESWSGISLKYCLSLYPNCVSDDKECPTIGNVVRECTTIKTQLVNTS